MDYKKIATEIVENVGGETNIISIMSCFTRVRIEVKNKEKVNMEELKKVPTVQGLNWMSNTIQVIVGNHCADVYEEVEKLVHVKENDASENTDVETKKMSFGARAIDYIGSTINPVVTVLVVSGLVQSIMALLNYLNYDQTTYVYQVFNAIGQTGYYFLPVFIAYSAAKKLHINQLVGAFVGAFMVYPAMVSLGGEGGIQHLFGLPVTMVSYASSITPILLTMPVVALVYNFIKKYCPKVISSMIVPLFTVVISIPIMLIVTGPIATWISNGLCGVVEFIFTKLSVVGGLIIGAIAPYLVMTGVHNGIALPITISELTTKGFSLFFPLLSYGNIAVGGAALGIYLRSKNEGLKTTALSGALMAIVGITEPALFGALLPTKKPLISLGIMDAICSAISLVLGVKCTALAMCGLGGLPAFFGDTFVAWSILMIISFIGACAITYFIGFEDVKETK